MDKRKLKELSTEYIIEHRITVQDHWIPWYERDSWLVPEKEYYEIVGN